MITCLGDMFFPEVGVAMVKVLRRLGVVRRLPGRADVLRHAAVPTRVITARRLRVAARTVDLFARSEHVVVPSGSCARMVKEEYPGLLKDDPRRAAVARELASRTRELSQFLVDVLGVRRSSHRAFAASSPTTTPAIFSAASAESLLAARPACGASRASSLVELPGADECCGFGGSFSVRLPEVSTAILAKKLDNVETTGADCLVACDGGCLMQMGGGLSRRRSRVRAAAPRAGAGGGDRA